MDVDTRGISCCFDEESRNMLEDYQKDGLADTSLAIADILTKEGLSGSNVVEIGCGFGGLSIELVRRGASRVVGMDLSPKMLELARELASQAAVADKTEFEQGDGAVAILPKSEIVILDSVLCCYPDVTRLVENTASASTRWYAIAVPDDTRLRTRLLKAVLPLQRVFFFRSRGFKFFIHPTKQLRKLLEQKGFMLQTREPQGWIWSVYLFARPAAV